MYVCVRACAHTGGEGVGILDQRAGFWDPGTEVGELAKVIQPIIS